MHAYKLALLYECVCVCVCVCACLDSSFSQINDFFKRTERKNIFIFEKWSFFCFFLYMNECWNRLTIDFRSSQNFVFIWLKKTRPVSISFTRESNPMLFVSLSVLKYKQPWSNHVLIKFGEVLSLSLSIYIYIYIWIYICQRIVAIKQHETFGRRYAIKYA